MHVISPGTLVIHNSSAGQTLPSGVALWSTNAPGMGHIVGRLLLDEIGIVVSFTTGMGFVKEKLSICDEVYVFVSGSNNSGWVSVELVKEL